MVSPSWPRPARARPYPRCTSILVEQRRGSGLYSNQLTIKIESCLGESQLTDMRTQDGVLIHELVLSQFFIVVIIEV